jgi:hypothetical protein
LCRWTLSRGLSSQPSLSVCSGEQTVQTKSSLRSLKKQVADGIILRRNGKNRFSNSYRLSLRGISRGRFVILIGLSRFVWRGGPPCILALPARPWFACQRKTKKGAVQPTFARGHGRLFDQFNAKGPSLSQLFCVDIGGGSLMRAQNTPSFLTASRNSGNFTGLTTYALTPSSISATSCFRVNFWASEIRLNYDEEPEVNCEEESSS